MKLSLALIGAIAADHTCDQGWSFQTGQSYTYKVKSTVDAVLNYNDGVHSPAGPGNRLDGELELNVFEGCTAEVTYKQRQGRSVKSIQALTTFHNGQIESVSFPQEQQISENNLLKALLSSVQMDGDGSLNKGIVNEITSFGPSASLYECNCECGLGVNCDCEHECGELRITRQAQVSIESDNSSFNPLVDKLVTKMGLDLDMQLDDSVCIYTHKAGVPSRISCEQTIVGTEGDQINAKLSMTATGSSSSSPMSLGRVTPCGLQITATEQDELVCNGDVECLMEHIPDVAMARTHAVKSQYILRKEINSMSDNQLSSLIEMAKTNPEADLLLNYLFTEIASCTSEACFAVIDSIPYPEAYPAVYHAALINPTQKAIDTIMNDIYNNPTTEKVDLLADIASQIGEGQREQSDLIISHKLDSMINDQCSFDAAPTTLAGYFQSTTRSLDENELFTWLQMANKIEAPLSIEKMLACVGQSSTKPIAEQAILNLALTLSPSDLVTKINPRSMSQLSAMVLALTERHGMKPVEIQQLFESYSISIEALNILLTTLDSTHAPADTSLWNEEIPISLPESLSQIQFLSGLTLTTQGGSRNMAAVEVINRLSNGMGENVLEIDLIVNDMYEILQLAVDSGETFTDEEWNSILETENAMVSFIQAILNRKFDQLANSPIFPHLKNFVRMGGVTVKVYGATVELGWMAEIMHNIEQFMSSLSAEQSVPSLEQLYGIFTDGIDHSYTNVLDSRSSVHVPLVNGMVVSQKRASIMSVNYRGTIFPDLLNLGSTGSLMVAPSMTAGNVVETSISGLEGIATRVDLTDGHFSFDIEAKYDISDDIKLYFQIAPTKSSPAHYQSQSFLTVDMPRDMRHTFVPSTDFFGSEVVLGYCDSGYEMYLDKEITGKFRVLKSNPKYFIPNVQASIESLGEVTLMTKGDSIQNGAVQLKAKTVSGVSYTTVYKQSCSDISDCNVALLVDLPNFEKVLATLDMSIKPEENEIHVKHDIKYGSQFVYRVKSDLVSTGTKSQASVAFSSDIDQRVEASIKCIDTLVTGMVNLSPMESANLECRLQANDYMGRINIEKSEESGRMTINTPIGSSRAVIQMNDDQFKTSFVVYSYPSDTFDQFEQMTKANMDGYQVVELMYQQKPNVSQGLLEIRGEQVLGFKIKYVSLSQHIIRVQSKALKLDLNSSVNNKNSVISSRQSFKWDQKMAESMTGLSLMYLSNGNEITLNHEISHNGDNYNHCSGAIKDDKVTIFKLSAGQSAVCASYNGNGYDNHVELTGDSEFTSVTPVRFTFNNHIENSLAQMNTELTVGDIIDINGALKGKYSAEAILLQGQAKGAINQKPFDYLGEVNGNLQAQNGEWNWASGSVAYSANGAQGKYELEAEHTQNAIGSQTVHSMKLTSPETDMKFTLYYVEDESIVYPVGFKFDSQERQINLLIVSSQQYAKSGYTSALANAQFNWNNNIVESLVKVNDINVKARVDADAATLEALADSPQFKLAITPSDGHLVKVQIIDVGHLSVNISNDFSISLNDLLFNIGNLETEYVGLNGLSTIHADKDGFQQCTIDHDIRVMKTTFHLTAALHTPSAQAVHFSDTPAYKFCQQKTLQSYALATFAKNSVGVWTTYNNDLSEFCLNGIREENTVIRQQIAFNIPVYNAVAQNNMPGYEDMNIQFKENTAKACYGENCVQGELKLENGAAALSAILPDVDVNVVLSGSFVDNTLKLQGSASHENDEWNIETEHKLTDSEYKSETSLDGTHSAYQKFCINWVTPELAIIHQSQLGSLDMYALVESESQIESHLKFDVLDQQLTSMLELNLVAPSVQLQADGVLANTEFSVKAQGDEDLIKLQAECGDFKHISSIGIKNIEIESVTEYGANNMEVSKMGTDGLLKMNFEYPVVGALFISSSEGNMKNIANLHASGISIFSIDSDLNDATHSIKLYADNVTFNYKQGTFSSTGIFDVIEWNLDGQIESAEKHQADFDVTIINKVSRFETNRYPVSISYQLDIPAQGASLNLKTNLFALESTGEVQKNLFLGTFSLKTNEFNIENAKIRAGEAKKTYVLDLDISPENLFEMAYGSSLVTINAQQNLNPILPSIQATWTPNTMVLSVEGYTNWIGGMSYDIEEVKFEASITGPEHLYSVAYTEESSYMTAKYEQVVNINAKYIAGDSLILAGTIIDGYLKIEATNQVQGLIEWSSPDALVQVTNKKDYQMSDNVRPITVQIFADQAGSLKLIVQNNNVDAVWNENELKLRGTVSDINADFAVNWETIAYDLNIDGYGSSRLSVQDNVVNFALDVNEIVKSVVNVDWQLFKMSTQGQLGNDDSWKIVISVPEEKAQALVVVNDASYQLDLTTYNGKVELENIGTMVYEYAEDQLQVKIQSSTNIQFVIDMNKYATKLLIANEVVELKLAHDGLDLSELNVNLSLNGENAFVLMINTKTGEIIINEASSGLDGQLNMQNNVLSGYINCEKAILQIELRKLELTNYIPTSLDMSAFIDGFNLDIDANQIEHGFEAEIESSFFKLSTHQELRLTPSLCLESSMAMDIMSMANFETELKFEDGNTNAGIAISSPIIKGVSQLVAKGFSIQKFSLENVLINTEALPVYVRGGAIYVDNSFTIHQTQIKYNPTGLYIFGLTKPVTITSAGLEPVNTKIIIGLTKSTLDFTDKYNFEIVNYDASNADDLIEVVHITGQEAVYDVAVSIDNLTIQSSSDFIASSNLRQKLQVTLNGEDLINIDLKRKDGYKGLIYASDDKNIKFTYQDGVYKALIVYEDIINVKLAGEGLTAAEGKVKISVVDLKYSLNNRLDNSSILLTVHKKPVVQFQSVSAQSFQIALNINDYVATYNQKDQVGQFEVESNVVNVNGDIDYNQQVLTVLVRRDQFTVLKGRIELRSDKIVAKIEAMSEHSLTVSIVPEEQRLMFKVNLNEDQIVSTGDFSLTQFNNFKILTQYGHGKCDQAQCIMKAIIDPYSVNAKLEFGKGFHLLVNGQDAENEVVQLVMTQDSGKLQIKFYNIVDLIGQRENNKIILAGQVDNTNINFDTTVGKDLLLDVNGPNVAFELELDQDYAKWNMSRPSVNSLEYDNGLFTLIGVKRRYELSTTDGEFNIVVAGLTQKK